MLSMIPYNDAPSFEELTASLRDGLRASMDISQKLEAICMREAVFPDEDREPPDTYGCDCLFLDFFVKEEMVGDFPLIAHDFFHHEYEHIKDYEDVEYLEYDNGRDDPSLIFTRYVLNLMMNAVNSGSTYAKTLFLYLHVIEVIKEKDKKGKRTKNTRRQL